MASRRRCSKTATTRRRRTSRSINESTNRPVEENFKEELINFMNKRMNEHGEIINKYVNQCIIMDIDESINE